MEQVQDKAIYLTLHHHNPKKDLNQKSNHLVETVASSRIPIIYFKELMMEYSMEDIINFIEQSGFRSSTLEANTSLESDLGIWGDDLDELLEDYAKKFEVDMSPYLWYFHTKEEGYSIGGLLFKPPNKIVDHIPITIDILVSSANMGTWSVRYPEHKLPKIRKDITVDLFVAIVIIIILIVSSIK